MSVLIAIALKSLLVSGITLALLALMKRRSAAERSWVAHIGLLALVVMAFAPLALPRWNVEAPAIMGKAETLDVAALTPAPPVAANVPAETAAAPSASGAPAVAAAPASRPSLSAAAAASALYAVPALLLLIVTLLAIARLIALHARADVLVDGHWLSALARAQRRMGFKHGTALLTSNELASPISWGLMRPVILLNTRAVEASEEAEAIIAHELAHVARMDWIKLLLARVATALFWFNPLVWLLAREAHQLREEAADDAVLSADIADTDYAQLLVGVARHECPGLLLGAHGVAPSKSSLARRVARVLDGKLVRGPVPRSFAVGIFAGALMVAAPLAALNFTPATAKLAAATGGSAAAHELTAAAAVAAAAPVDLPHIIASGVTTSVTTAAAAIAPVAPIAPTTRNLAAVEPDYEAVAPSGARVVRKNGVTVATAPNGATTTIYPPDANGRSRVVAVASNGATAITYSDASDHQGRAGRDRTIDTAIAMKATGVTPEYVAAMRAASPALNRADGDDIIGLKAVGVTPDYVRALAGAGYGNLSADQLQEARAIGLTPEYVRSIRSTGVRPTLDELVELRAMNVSPDELARVRASGAVTRERIRDVVPPRRPPPPPSLPDEDDDG